MMNKRKKYYSFGENVEEAQIMKTLMLLISFLRKKVFFASGRFENLRTKRKKTFLTFSLFT